MRRVFWIVLGAVVLGVAGCAMPTERPVVVPAVSDHPHVHPAAKNAGDWHVYNFMNRRAQKIGVQVLDRYEEPYYLDAAQLRATITRANGETSELALSGEGYEPAPQNMEDYAGQRPSATVYSAHLPWIRDEHEVALTVWVPLPDGNTYELAFACVAREPSPTHSGN